MSAPFLSSADLRTIINTLTTQAAQLPWPENEAVTPALIQQLATQIVADLNAAHGTKS